MCGMDARMMVTYGEAKSLLQWSGGTQWSWRHTEFEMQGPQPWFDGIRTGYLPHFSHLERLLLPGGGRGRTVPQRPVPRIRIER